MRDESEKVNARKAEMMESKIKNAIKMLRRAIVEGVMQVWMYSCSSIEKATALGTLSYPQT